MARPSSHHDAIRAEIRPFELLQAAAALGALVVALFHEAVFERRVFFERDIHAYWLPHIEAFVRSLAEGAWPLWNPWVSFGTPLLADPNLQLAYPPTWLNLVLQPADVYTLFVLSHCLGTALGAYLLARRLGLSRLPALLVGASWCSSGPLLSAASLFHHFASAAWLPWVIWSLERALWRRTRGATLLVGCMAAGQLLAGSADLVFMTALIVAARVLVFVARGVERKAARAWLAFRLGGVAAGFALLLSAVQWWPTLAQLPRGARLDLSHADRLYWSIHPGSLLDLIVPRLVADLPVSEALRTSLYEGREPLLVSLYLGLPVVALAGLGALSGWSRRPGLLAVGMGLFVLAALGRHTPFMVHLVDLPVLGLFRYPAKYLIPASFICALLAGFGLQHQLERRDAGRAFGGRRAGALVTVALVAFAVVAAAVALWIDADPQRLAPILDPAAEPLEVQSVPSKLWVAVLLAVAVVLLLSRSRRRGRPWTGLALAALSIVDLALAGRKVNTLAPRELLTHRPPVLGALDPSLSAPRLFVMSYPLNGLAAQLTRGPLGWRPEWRRALGNIERLVPPIGARFGLSGSFDGEFTGMATPARSLMTAAAGRSARTPALLRLLHLGGVDYVVALHDPDLPGLVEVARLDSVYSEPIRLLRVVETLPRCYVVGRARAVPGIAAIRDLLDPAFEPFSEVVLDESPGRVAEAGPGGGTARITARAPDRIDLEVECDGPGYLVVTEAHDPGWRAVVDDQPAQVSVANLLFRCVRVPAGRHRVRMWYRPPAVFWGAVASVLAVVLGLLSWEADRRRRGSGAS
jgi:hypothetical protein